MPKIEHGKDDWFMRWKRLVIALLCCCVLGTAFSEESQGLSDNSLALSEYAEVATPKGSLNMRSVAQKSGTVLKRIPNHTMLHVIKKEDDWSKVAYGGKEGYVLTQYLSFLEELPFDTLEEGDRSKEVLRLKKRLQELGYFRSGATDMIDSFTKTMAKRIQIFQKVNGMKQTGIATPELQAFIFWGNALKNTTYLPPAPYYVSGGTGNGEATDPASGLSVKITCKRTGYKLISRTPKQNEYFTWYDEEYESYYSVSVSVSGGTPKYDIKVYTLSGENNYKEEIKGSTFSMTYVAHAQISDFWILAQVTDADGNSVSAKEVIQYYQPPSEWEENEEDSDW